MEQKQLPLMGRLDAPSVAPTQYVSMCKSYRQAVRLSWEARRARKMTQATLAAEAELRPQLVSDYLNRDDKRSRKSLPAERIAAFEAIVGNTLVSQWIAAQSKLTVLEELQAVKAAA